MKPFNKKHLTSVWPMANNVTHICVCMVYNESKTEPLVILHDICGKKITTVVVSGGMG